MPGKKEILCSVAEKIDSLDIPWAVIGKTSLALQGLFVRPSKIGILIRHTDKERVRNAFVSYPLQKSFMLPNGEGEEEIRTVDGIDVQFCFEFEHGFYTKYLNEDSLIRIRLGTVDVPCLRLGHEASAYEYLGETEMAETIREFLRTKVSSDDFRRLLDFAQTAYSENNISAQALRPGGPFPYLVHPLWAATMFSNDRNLMADERVLGFQTLVLHDILEDTSAMLPEWVRPEVQNLVREMTFTDWEEKKRVIGSKSAFVKLLLLADGLANMYEETVGEQKRPEYKQQVAYLLGEAEKNYPSCRMIAIGKATLAATEW